MNPRKQVHAFLLAITIGAFGSASAEPIRIDQLEARLASAKSDQVRTLGARVYQVSYPNGRIATYWFGAEGAAWILANRSPSSELREMLSEHARSSSGAKATIIRPACQAWTLTMDGGIVYSVPGAHYARAITKLERPVIDFGTVPNFSLTTYAYAALGTQAPPTGSENQTWTYGTALGGPNPIASEVAATCPTQGACSTSWVTTHAYSIAGCESGGIEWQGSN